LALGDRNSTALVDNRISLKPERSHIASLRDGKPKSLIANLARADYWHRLASAVLIDRAASCPHSIAGHTFLVLLRIPICFAPALALSSQIYRRDAC
jgi:hypothetical protein